MDYRTAVAYPVAAVLRPPNLPPIPLTVPLLPLRRRRPLNLTIRAAVSGGATAASAAQVDMVRGRDGVWSAGEQKVVVLWDLDNKPPRGPPYEAAVALRSVASLCGRVVDFSAYANRHAFDHLPRWILDQRRQRRELDILERKNLVDAPSPYVCGVCGRKCRTNLDLKKHFRQLHEREREKKLSRMRSLKGKKRQRYRERFVSGNLKYEEAARELLTPKAGYGLAPELRRAGVYVKMVEDKPQAADSALKRQMQHSMTRGIDWLFLVSDDSDFTDMIRRARESGLRTVVVGDGWRALGRHADFWVPWMGVENGEVGEEALWSGAGDRVRQEGEIDGSFSSSDLYGDRREGEVDGSFSSSDLYGEDNVSYLDDVVDEIVVSNSGNDMVRMSAFSEEEVLERREGDNLENGNISEDLFWSSDEEDDIYI